MTTVREFSVAGPCIRLGELVGRTPKGVTFITPQGVKESRRGYRVERGLIHTEPCPSCRDHVKTQYPNGYMD